MKGPWGVDSTAKEGRGDEGVVKKAVCRRVVLMSKRKRLKTYRLSIDLGSPCDVKLDE